MKQFPEEVTRLLPELIPGRRNEETAAEIYSRTGYALTAQQVRTFRNNHHISNGLQGGSTERRVWTQEIVDWIRERAAEAVIPRADMVRMVNEHFGTAYTYGQLSAMYKNEGIRSEYDTRFKKGNKPLCKNRVWEHPNSIATRFGKGNQPHNTVPVGTVNKTTDGYLKKKLPGNPPKWAMLHILNWEEAHGPVPEGMMIIFADGNKENCDISNLRMVDKGTNGVLNKMNLRSEDGTLTDTGIAVAKIMQAMNKRKGKRNGKTKPTAAEAPAGD